MGQNLTQKILAGHLVSGSLEPGTEIAVRVDQTLTQDATGTMAYLQFEAMHIPRVKTELSVSYIDHNTLQTGFENADDHRFLQTMAARYGIYYSRAGNGICHQVHLERFGVPGKTLLGSDSHTPTAGGLGMLAIGVGGLNVAVAMGGGPFYLIMPKVVHIRLHGRPAPWTTAKDIILEVLRRLSVKGGVGKILEYGGEGIKYLTVPERATITNMGAETGATTSIFPSDEVTLAFLRAQGREDAWVELRPDPDAAYDETLDIDLGALEPLVACPHSPDNVKPVREVGPLAVDQVVIGSCTNSSYLDLMKVAAILKGKVVHPDVSLVIAPGSRQVLAMLAQNGALADLVAAGARILECACGPCIGMGQAPPSGGISVRTINRNFKGRSGTADGQVYLVSPETAAATALTGRLTDPRELGDPPVVALPEKFPVDDRMILPPAADPAAVEIRRGPNIKPLPVAEPVPENIRGRVLLRVGDNITTDHIMPAGAKVLPLRSNIPAMAEYAFAAVDPSFPARAREAGGGIIVGGENYGQGSSREHAALVPMYLGVKAVLAKSFARIHRDNLINFGILPLTFVDPADYDRVGQDDVLEMEHVPETLQRGAELVVKNVTRNATFKVRAQMTPRQVRIVLAGGLLNYTRGNN
ncbi:aconitate hydratase [Desulfofundulus thermobenzoicus]|uniref:Aconitate hydratase n=1 Tax=Desulfofundulus thermobenzoicus TaxID=29376 RepID=A0A6N7IUJ5_9FIRM|nr:aconitate hydratase [Desulfofundulus thermobenzoicus]MQL53117.1 aconitate hydratase [Desulfofundulus thermobenzoicus]